MKFQILSGNINTQNISGGKSMKKSLLPLVLLSASSLLLATVAPTVSVFAEDDATEETVESTEEEAEETSEEAEETEESTEELEESEEEETEEAEGEALTIKVGAGSPHGERSFGYATVLLQGDVVVDVILDEFQFIDGDWEGVPSSNGGFADGIIEGQTLMSKMENEEAYSTLMEENAGSTNSYADNFGAIQDFAKGKTVAELEEAVAELNGLGEDASVADVVSGATLVDTAGYLAMVVDVINDGYAFEGVPAGEDVQLSRSLQAPHGNNSFAIVSAAHDGETVYAAAIDEFQFWTGNVYQGVPNSDGAFSQGFADPSTFLGSKITNSTEYSRQMAEIAGATNKWADNITAVTDFAEGKPVTDIEAAIEELGGLGEDQSIADVVSGATLVDTHGYLQAIVDTVNGVEHEEPAAEEVEEEGGDDAVAVDFSNLEDGTYTGVGEGHNDDLEVEVVVEGGAITAVNILNHAETDGISDPAREEIPAAIVEANSTDVDIVSSASYTSRAIIEAVNNALAQ